METPSITPAAVPVCRTCGGPTIGWGRDAHGNPRRKCKACKATFGIIPPRPLGAMRISLEDASLCLRLLTEGNSIRSTERISGHHRDTIMRLLRKAGAKCETLLNSLVRGVEVKDVQADELWCFVGTKEKTKERKGRTDPELGDAYTWISLERESKLALAWHLGRRTSADASVFMAKTAAATSGRFQLTTDGLNAYPAAVEEHLGGRVDYGQLIKTYSSETVDSERRYSPARIISAEKVAVSGDPDPAKGLHLARRAHQPARADDDAPLHPVNQRLQPEAGESAGRARAPLRDLQLHLDALLYPDDSGDEGGDCSGTVDNDGSHCDGNDRRLTF